MHSADSAPVARSGDVLLPLQDLRAWRAAIIPSAAVSLPGPIGAALLDVAVAAIVAHQLAPSAPLAAAVSALHAELEANRARLSWTHARMLFAGTRPHA
ncbi:hypothetical protein [Gemmatimonas sp.]